MASGNTICFQFTSFRFSARCHGCGKCGGSHEVGGKFFCGDCCPGCRVVKPFEDEPLPAGLAGEQASLFGGKE